MLDSNIPSNTPPITQTNNQPLTTNLSNLADSGVSNTQTTRTTSPYSVIRRNGQQTPFDLVKITLALTKAFLAVEGQHANSSARIHELVEGISQQVYKALIRRLPESGVMFIEDIQDQVELGLMRAGEQKVARAYVLYRSQREMERQSSLNKNSKTKPKNVSSVKVVSANDESLDIEYAQIQQLINILG